MPDKDMASLSSAASHADILGHIQNLRASMDLTEERHVDGFSDSDQSFAEDNKEIVPRAAIEQEQDGILVKDKSDTGIFNRHIPGIFYKTHDHTNPNHNRPKSSTSSKSKASPQTVKQSDHNDNDNKHHSGHHHHHNDRHGDNNHSHNHHKHHHSHHHDQHKHSSHHHHSNGHHHHNQHRSNDSENNAEPKQILQYDLLELMPIIAGQRLEDVNMPIMTPPPEDTRPVSCFSINSRGVGNSPMFATTMSFRFFTAGEQLPCSFQKPTVENKSNDLLEINDRDPVNQCFCSATNTTEDVLSGWELPPRLTKTKCNRRKRSSMKHGSSDVAFNRLTQTLGKDPVIFHHYKDLVKYIERYRFYHTVGNVGRPPAYSQYGEKTIDTDPYVSKMRSNIRAINSPIYSHIQSQLRERRVGSASSTESSREWPNVDEESLEASSIDSRLVSMRERGKALNLAPVREYTVPCLQKSDKMDVIQINQYLNLTTPPTNCIQFEMDDTKVKRYTTRSSTESLFPLSTVRRGARPLRLGSAEFIKPGTLIQDAKWTQEKGNAANRPSTSTPSTVPGNLIVGSTAPSPIFRAKSAKMSPYIQFQKEQHNLIKPQTPPQHVAGRKMTVTLTDRGEASSASRERRGKFSYTHAAKPEKPPPIVKTATVMDFNTQYQNPMRERMKTITLDVNHLGIRGTTFKRSEEIAVYKISGRTH
ncbi:uncharacterized protein LOC128231442 [Mya arenaria]|uniref:uncharacterized protein LOC128231442 n=1 Tax=Mya arenaria TaxID=6604 RepID=UPI0022E15B5A|nr:uncharacterized protein LOC128231442 [Mya arenaria]XP_052800233.1 uncharacterized protein LOC128231442 [Mya arenaria]